MQGLVLLKIDDEQWTLDLRAGGKGSLVQGAPEDKPDLTLTVSDENFAKLVMGKMNPQQVRQARPLGAARCMDAATCCWRTCSCLPGPVPAASCARSA